MSTPFSSSVDISRERGGCAILSIVFALGIGILIAVANSSFEGFLFSRPYLSIVQIARKAKSVGPGWSLVYALCLLRHLHPELTKTLPQFSNSR